MKMISRFTSDRTFGEVSVHEIFQLFSLYLVVQFKNDGENENIILRFYDAEDAIVIENSLQKKKFKLIVWSDCPSRAH